MLLDHSTNVIKFSTTTQRSVGFHPLLMEEGPDHEIHFIVISFSLRALKMSLRMIQILNQLTVIFPMKQRVLYIQASCKLLALKTQTPYLYPGCYDGIPWCYMTFSFWSYDNNNDFITAYPRVALHL